MPWSTELLLLGTLTSVDGVSPPPPAELEIDVQPPHARYMKASWPETGVFERPWTPSKRIGTVAAGTRLIVRGVVPSRDDGGCKGDDWLAILPYGFICSRALTEADEAPDGSLALQPDEGRLTPFQYAFVRSESAPLYANLEALEARQPSETLERGMSLAVARTAEFEGYEFVRTENGEYVPKADVRWGGQGSAWHGVYISGRYEGPSFAWAHKDKVPVRDAPSPDAKRIGKLDRRERVPLLRSNGGAGKAKFFEIADGRWVAADDLNEVHLMAPPPGTAEASRVRKGGSPQWIDVDLGEQVLVAYRGDKPVYATLISSGRGNRTPRGNYPVWAKVASVDMGNQGYEDSRYLVQGVPWVEFFQAGIALHGTYWHDGFGQKKSHGCVNLSPTDARWVFEWLGPQMLAGWTGLLPHELDVSPVVHIRDSSRPEGSRWTQDAPIGPADPEEEKRKLAEAEERRTREAEAAAAMAALDPGATGVDPSGSPPRLQPKLPAGFGAPSSPDVSGSVAGSGSGSGSGSGAGASDPAASPGAPSSPPAPSRPAAPAGTLPGLDDEGSRSGAPG